MWHRNILSAGDCVLVQAHPSVTYDQKIAIEDELDIQNIHTISNDRIIEINFGERTAFQYDRSKAICTWFSKSENQIVDIEAGLFDGLLMAGLGIGVIKDVIESENCRDNFVVSVSWR